MTTWIKHQAPGPRGPMLVMGGLQETPPTLLPHSILHSSLQGTIPHRFASPHLPPTLKTSVGQVGGQMGSRNGLGSPGIERLPSLPCLQQAYTTGLESMGDEGCPLPPQA